MFVGIFRSSNLPKSPIPQASSFSNHLQVSYVFGGGGFPKTMALTLQKLTAIRRDRLGETGSNGCGLSLHAKEDRYMLKGKHSNYG
jgi:hypothetical protein